MRGLWRFWLDELARSLPEYKRVVRVANSHYYALIQAGEEIAKCSCHPHADGALAIIEKELDYTFQRRYPPREPAEVVGS